MLRWQFDQSGDGGVTNSTGDVCTNSGAENRCRIVGVTDTDGFGVMNGGEKKENGSRTGEVTNGGEKENKGRCFVEVYEHDPTGSNKLLHYRGKGQCFHRPFSLEPRPIVPSFDQMYLKNTHLPLNPF